jgi:bifunctional non-homologous end joining protein LigD
LYAFDLLELNGVLVSERPLLDRKKRLQTAKAKVRDGIYFNDHVEGDGAIIFAHACKLGCEGKIAKRIDLPYQSGRSKRWLKIKNSNSPAAKRAEDGTF